jgi:hypothetical protein
MTITSVDTFVGLVILAAFIAIVLGSRRSAALNRMFLRSCIPQTRTCESDKESSNESKCRNWITRIANDCRLAVVASLDSRTQAPTVAGFQSLKPAFGDRGRKIVAARFGKFEKCGGHDGADGVAHALCRSIRREKIRSCSR